MGARDLSGPNEDPTGPPVTVGAVFERFPASIRGALVVRGGDPDPHQVRLVAASVVEAHHQGRPIQPIAIDPVVVDLAPRAEVLIPFDVPLAGMAPGWYTVSAEVDVDGTARVRGPAEGKRFVVPWAGHDVRKGAVEAGLAIVVPGSAGAVIERIECKADRAVVRWRHAAGDEPEFGDLRVSAGSRRLHVLEGAYDPASGSRTTMVYPVLKTHRQLTFELDRRHVPGGAPEKGRWSATLDLS